MSQSVRTKYLLSTVMQVQHLLILLTASMLANSLRLRSLPTHQLLRSKFFSVEGSGQEATWSGEEDDDHFMRLALRHAQLAYRQKEVPIGAVVVDNERRLVISAARNCVEKMSDATAHAEMLAIQKAVKFNKNWRLNNCTLYTTLEPCPMCMGAIQSSRISRVVFGTRDQRMGACGSWVDLIKENKHPFHQVNVRGGVCEHECSDILKRFFRWRRKENIDKDITQSRQRGLDK